MWRIIWRIIPRLQHGLILQFLRTFNITSQYLLLKSSALMFLYMFCMLILALVSCLLAYLFYFLLTLIFLLLYAIFSSVFYFYLTLTLLFIDPLCLNVWGNEILIIYYVLYIILFTILFIFFRFDYIILLLILQFHFCVFHFKKTLTFCPPNKTFLTEISLL